MKAFAQILVVCTIVEAIAAVRPQAEWNLRGTNYAGLEWLDKNQAKPTPAELATTILACQAAESSRLTAKAQARIDVKNGSLTQAQRMSALLVLLDFDQ